MGVRFARGGDGGAYVAQTDPKLGNTDEKVQVCDLLGWQDVHHLHCMGIRVLIISFACCATFNDN